MNKKVTLKDIAIMQSGIYMKTDSQGEVRYLQVKDVNSENKLDYTQIATVINTGINDKHWLKNGDLLFAAKGGSNYCIQYEGGRALHHKYFLNIYLKLILHLLLSYVPSLVTYYRNSFVVF